MKKLLAGLFALALMLTPVLAQMNTNVGMYEASPATIIEGQKAPVLLDNLRRQVVISLGSVASGATDSGNPVKIGCKYNATLSAFTDGQRADCQSDANGSILVIANGRQMTGSDGIANNSLLTMGTSTLQTNGTRPLINAPFRFNGSTWDRAFTCPSTAVVNVTAAATTQIVALASSQIIRVCSFSVAMSAAGTAKFVYGTGTNCGTGTTDITGATPLATGTPWTVSSGSGSVLRTIASNALCLAAVTGNVVGFITYAQY